MGHVLLPGFSRNVVWFGEQQREIRPTGKTVSDKVLNQGSTYSLRIQQQSFCLLFFLFKNILIQEGFYVLKNQLSFHEYVA